MSTTPPAPDQYARLDDVAHQLQVVQPLVGHFLSSAVALTRSGEMAPRQLAAATLSVAKRLGDDHRAFADQLRGAVQAILPPHRRVTDAPNYEHPILFREGL